MSSMKNSITVDVSKMAQAENDFQLRCQIIEEVKEYQITSVCTEEFAHIGVAVGKTGECNVILQCNIHVDLDNLQFICIKYNR